MNTQMNMVEIWGSTDSRTKSQIAWKGWVGWKCSEISTPPKTSATGHSWTKQLNQRGLKISLQFSNDTTQRTPMRGILQESLVLSSLPSSLSFTSLKCQQGTIDLARPNPRQLCPTTECGRGCLTSRQSPTQVKAQLCKSWKLFSSKSEQLF